MKKYERPLYVINLGVDSGYEYDKTHDGVVFQKTFKGYYNEDSAWKPVKKAYATKLFHKEAVRISNRMHRLGWKGASIELLK